jgi:hypothetical protein
MSESFNREAWRNLAFGLDADWCVEIHRLHYDSEVKSTCRAYQNNHVRNRRILVQE